MSVLARLFGAISSWFESRASAKHILARLTRLEEQNVVLQKQMDQVRVDMTKCKFMVGLNQITEVTAE